MHCAPRVVLAPHDHTLLPAAYVYLNDGGPILFTHVDLPYGAVTRPPTKAGSFRLYRGLMEVHAVENPTDTPSEFLRVEFRTGRSTRTRCAASSSATTTRLSPPPSTVQFDHAQVRVSRVVVAPRESLEIAVAAECPTLLAALIEALVELDRPGEPLAPPRVEIGGARWLGTNHRARLRGQGDRPANCFGSS